MNAIDILVQACDVEGSPRAVVEAMAAARPAVVPAGGGSAEAVENGVTGLLVKPDSAQKLADGIHRLVQSPSLRVSLGVAGHEHVELSFGSDRFAVRF